MKKTSLLVALALFLICFQGVFAFEEKSCGVYFTYAYCHNCESTDPLVLVNWTKEHNDIAIIEYYFDDWMAVNGLVLRDYSGKYSTRNSVPQLILSEENTPLGAILVPASLGELVGKNNPCLLLDGPTQFSELDFDALPGKPKIWANNRMIKRVMETESDSLFLKTLLFSENPKAELENSGYSFKSINKKTAPIAFGSIEFENAIEIENSWVFYLNEDLTDLNENIIQSTSIAKENNSIELPFFGAINKEEISLPILTLMLGLVDGFNPCAFFMLTILLSAMMLARSRKRILVTGFVFIFFSALIYFISMTVWFEVIQHLLDVALIAITIGVIASIAGIINIKDYFYFKKGISLTLPTSQKERFMKKVKELSSSESLWGLALGTALLAATVNLYELLCTVGFPVIFVGILKLRGVIGIERFFYLALYCFVYILPLIAIVLIFAFTLGKMKFGVTWVKRLKLVSGMMILFLGITILIDRNAIFRDILIPFYLIALAIVVSLAIFAVKKHFFKKW